jgi:hypothetical protein
VATTSSRNKLTVPSKASVAFECIFYRARLLLSSFGSIAIASAKLAENRELV